jgi:hypothetical protein
MVKPCGSFQVIIIDFLHVHGIMVGLEGPNAYGWEFSKIGSSWVFGWTKNLLSFLSPTLHLNM